MVTGVGVTGIESEQGHIGQGGGHLGAVVKYPSFEPKVARSIPDPPTFVMKFPRNFRNQGPSIEVQPKLTHPKILD